MDLSSRRLPLARLDQPWTSHRQRDTKNASFSVSDTSHSASNELTEFSNIFILRDPQLPMETSIQQDGFICPI